MRQPEPIDFNGIQAEACDPAVAEGLRRFFEEVTTPNPSNPAQRFQHPSFSLTSRRYSVWSKLRKHVDTPLIEALQSYQGIWDSRLLMGFKLSKAGSQLPMWCEDRDAYKKAMTSGLPVALVIPYQQNTSSTLKLEKSEADKIVEAVEAWKENAHSAQKSIASLPPSMVSGNSTDQFASTLETIGLLLGWLHQFRPKRGADPLRMQDGTHPQLPDSKTRRQGKHHCELCWRLTMRAAAVGSWPGSPDVRSRQLSGRFCVEHDPSDPNSRYRVDHRYKSAFQLERVRGIRSKFFLIDLQAPLHPSFEEVRKTAYNRVHARIRPLTQLDQPSFRETVWQLHQKGMRQADIARKLDTSRQSVSRTLKKTKQLLADHEEWRKLDPIKEAYKAMSHSDKLAQAVPLLDARGLTPAEIAKIVDEPLATVMQILER